MWQIKWLRRFVRRNTKPIGIQKAVDWKQRLSIFYAIIAWNAFGLVCYMAYTGRKDWAKHYGYKSDADANTSPARQWAKTLNMEHATIVRVSGMQVQESEEFMQEKEKTEEENNHL